MVANSVPDMSILNSFEELAKSDSNYDVLLHDEISLQGLVLLLSNEDHSIVSMVLRIFSALRDRDGAKPILQTLLGLKEQLEVVVASHGSSTVEEHKEITHAANALLQSLKKEVSVQNRQFSPGFRPRNIVLRLYGISSESDVELVRERLLKVRGVVSVTFQVAKRRAIVCAVPNLDPALLVSAVRSAEQANTVREEPQPSDIPIQARIVRKRSQL
ncbi:unnamed protein product [Echinostoma caproni]|uniref:Armadillo repeat-containing protein 1 n=1 Tax=Echinostoma caproni TaxID=27848 RepID=A0A183B2D0_9TREM|nr:unnamed protein product [Echinostoma caproni]